MKGRRPSPDSISGRLVEIVLGLGHDKYGAPLSIKTRDLADRAGIPGNQVQCNMSGPVARGEVVVCKVTPAGGRPYNEYRAGPGKAPPEFRPLNTRRAGIALGAPGHRGGTAPAVHLSTSKPGVNEIEPASLGKPQPAVGTLCVIGKPLRGRSTPAAGDCEPPSTVEPAVTAAKATPKPTARVRLKKEPAAPRALAGDAIRINIDNDGTLLIATDEGVFELQPKQCRRLGNFMLGSQGIWNPF